MKKQFIKKDKVGEWYFLGECSVCVSKDPNFGKICWHISIAHPNRYPTYEEIKEARYEFIPDEAIMAMLFPPKSQFVNVHPNCFHLWQIN
jgi:hypothetical protein